MSHLNIAQVHGFEQADGMHALVMELVEGDELSRRIDRGAIPFGEAVAIARQIAEALDAAHDKGVVRRDLKPAGSGPSRSPLARLLLHLAICSSSSVQTRRTLRSRLS